MKNRFRGLSESRKLEMLQMSVEEIYNAGCNAGEISRKLSAILNPAATKSPNQRRAELIQRAREFVEEHEKPLAGDEERMYGHEYCRHHYYESEFVTKKNRVTAIIHLINYRGKRLATAALIGRANCAPGEVFNADIGKAIALARALEIEIPQEFLQAVQPDVPTIGSIIRGKIARPATVSNIEKINGETVYWRNETGAFLTKRSAVIVEDTNAAYPEVPPC